jgi:hypothetical protein
VWVDTVGLPVDLREIAAQEPPPVDEHAVRVPTAEETAESIQRAQRALTEIALREATDQARAEDERVEQLARWHTEDSRHAADAAGGDERCADRADRDADQPGPVLELGAPDA